MNEAHYKEANKYVSLRLRVQNQRNFPLNFRTMRKLSELYSEYSRLNHLDVYLV